MGFITKLAERLRNNISSDDRFGIEFFKDKSIQDEIARVGYVTGPLLKPGDLAQLKEDFNQLRKMVPGDIPIEFWPSGRFEDPKVRNFARDAIEKVLPQRLTRYFDREIADFVGGTCLIKPPGPKTDLWPHQDSSHVDETKSFSVYAWVPLVDTDVNNGALHVLPGSHKFGNIHRSLNVPWQFEGLQKIMFKYLKPLPMKAGEVCFFDSATIHYSPDNKSDDFRVAVNYFVKPLAEPFLHCYIDEQTPKGKVEVYNLSIDYFYDEDFESRPPEEKLLRYEDCRDLELNPEKMEELCLQGQKLLMES